MNEVFSLFFLSFMVIMTLHRILEMFLMTKRREKGIIHKKWTLAALTVVHVLVGIFAIFRDKIWFFASKDWLITLWLWYACQVKKILCKE